MELKALRRKELLPNESWFRFTDYVFDTAEALARQQGVGPLTGEALFYSYTFRYALRGLARAVDRISQGGHATTPLQKLMNEYTDMGYAAYATFLDGILTRDEKLKEVHRFATRL